jgi:hypothetical protein
VIISITRKFWDLTPSLADPGKSPETAMYFDNRKAVRRIDACMYVQQASQVGSY